MKDIFIDANIAAKLARPKDDEYKKLIDWLLQYDEQNILSNAHLVVSQHLLGEYFGCSGGSSISTCITVIVDKFIKQKRLIKFSKEDLEKFKKKHYKASILKNIKCNAPDKEHHIPTVLLSCRKYALVEDNKLRDDLNGFPGFHVKAVIRPEELPYAD